MPEDSGKNAIELWRRANAGLPTIRKADMIRLLLEACPGFRPTWEQHVQDWDGQTPGVYIDIARFVAYLLQAFKDGKTDCVHAAFETLERFLVEGDFETQEHAVIGFIESVQNVAARETFGADAFVPFLKPHSLQAWRELDEWWQGKSKLRDSEE